MRTGIGILLLFIPTPALAQEKDKYQHAFRGGEFSQSVMQLVGRHATRQVRSHAEGLRIILPADKGPFQQIGVTPKFKIIGDFDVSVGYKILDAQQPKTGYGIGFSIFVRTESAEENAATLGIFRTKMGKLHYAANFHTGKQGERKHMTQNFPAEENALSGRLRFMRMGKELVCAVAPGTSEEYMQLRVIDLGDEPLARLRIAADQGGGNATVDVVLKDIVIEADSLTTESEQLEEASSWGLWAIAGGLLAAVIAGGLFYWHRRRRGSDAV
jgi:hypothetical protein